MNRPLVFSRTDVEPAEQNSAEITFGCGCACSEG